MFTRLKQLFAPSRLKQSGVFDTPVTPDGPFYAVGDIHGRIDLLDRLLEIIDADIAETPGLKPHLVFVGDYVDRGEHSADVLARLMHLTAALPDQTVCLMGNHEKMMLDFLRKPVERGPRS